MLEGSQLSSPPQGRPLLPLERELIEKMLAGKDVGPGGEARLSSALVADMQDGGMGSIRFLSSEHAARHLGRAITQAEYIDEDGVLVSIVVNVDQEDEIYEVDFWKVDFSPLKRYPRASDIKIEGAL
jgi:hypothetical protein